MTKSSADEGRFWSIAEPLLGTAAVTRSTMMGFPCLRVSGQFFASFDRRTNALIVKLPATRVQQLIESREADPFAPAGRTFREWAAIAPARLEQWPSLIDEALAFVAER